MPNSAEKNRERRELRKWVTSNIHPEGGWWQAPVPEEDHGKFGTYSNWHCRCPPCQAANAEKQKEYRASHPAGIPAQRKTE